MVDSASPSRLGRRAYLSAVGIAAVGAASTSVLAGDAPERVGQGRCAPADDSETSLEDERTELAEKRDELESLRAEVASLRSEIDDLDEETRRRRTRFPESVRDRAREVGVTAREGVVGIELGVPGRVLPGWFLEDGLVVTTGGLFLDDNVPDLTTGTAWLPGGDALEWELEATVELGPDVWGIAVLAVDLSEPPLPIGDAASLSAGDRLVQIGHVPHFGNWVVTLGEYERRTEDGSDLLVGDVPVAFGSGGAPVLSLEGEVVGMTVQTGPHRSDDLPEYLQRSVHHEHLPDVFESRHIPVETVRKRVEESV